MNSRSTTTSIAGTPVGQTQSSHKKQLHDSGMPTMVAMVVEVVIHPDLLPGGTTLAMLHSVTSTVNAF